MTNIFFICKSRNYSNKKYNQSSSDRLSHRRTVHFYFLSKQKQIMHSSIRIQFLWLTAARTFNFKTIFGFFFAFHTINLFTFNEWPDWIGIYAFKSKCWNPLQYEDPNILSVRWVTGCSCNVAWNGMYILQSAMYKGITYWYAYMNFSTGYGVKIITPHLKTLML